MNNNNNKKKIQYPYIEYDDEVKAIYIYFIKTEPTKHFASFPFKSRYNNKKGKAISIFADVDNEDNITGLEILLPKDYDSTYEYK
jgi:hypothetical protein